MNIAHWLTLAFSTATVVILFFTVLNLAAAEWHWKQVGLWRTDPDEARARKANPPWYVRATSKEYRR